MITVARAIQRRQYLEDQLAALEHGTRGLALSSGMAAIHTALAIFKAGDHIIVGDQIYGGTFRLLNQFFERWGLSATPVDTRDPAAIERAIQPNTKAVYFEPVTNPLLQVTSIAAVAKVAKKHDLLTIVDNTFLSPYLCQPLPLGADIVIHSATKYLAGHSDVSAGAVITNDEKLGDRLYFVQNALGAVLSPEDSNLVRAAADLSVRMDRQQANVKAIIAHLQPLPAVKKSIIPVCSASQAMKRSAARPRVRAACFRSSWLTMWTQLSSLIRCSCFNWQSARLSGKSG